MNKNQFFLHSGSARYIELGFMLAGLALFVALIFSAAGQVSAKEPVYGVNESVHTVAHNQFVSDAKKTLALTAAEETRKVTITSPATELQEDEKAKISGHSTVKSEEAGAHNHKPAKQNDHNKVASKKTKTTVN